MVAAHALWNNDSTVGVSVMGNFEANTPNSDQDNGITAAIQWLTKKYGIDINKTSIGHKECKNTTSCLLSDYTVPNLIGHRDVGYTACPGQNLYAELPGFKQVADAYSSGYTLVDNPVSLYQSSAPVANTVLKSGSLVRIKLSFTGSVATIDSATDAPLQLSLLGKTGTLRANIPLSFTADPSGSGILLTV